jgi:outer membrane lipoprotein carrier protein
MRLILFLAILISSFSTLAIESKDLNYIKMAEYYFASFENLEANFIQHGNKNQRAGKLYISKPGKFRWEYDDKLLLIVSTGDTIIYVDNELEEVHYISADDTVAGLLSQSNIDLTNGDYRAQEVKTGKGMFSVLIHNVKQEELGKINVYFSQSPLSLKAIEVLDAGNNIVKLELSDISYPATLDSELFNYYENHNRRW